MQSAAGKFARDLKDLVLARGTIAQACKETGINRQQFNKYLAGQITPSARNMRTICAYLGVAEEQLMSGRFTPLAAGQRPGQSEIDIGAHSTTDYPTHPAMLRPGFYRSYFPIRGLPNHVARWLVHVTTCPNGMQMHTCRNRFRNGAAMGYAADRIRYCGPVLYGSEEASMMGTARTPAPLHGNIFVNLRPVVEQDYFSAMVLTRRADGPLALAGVMQFLGAEYSARRALAGMGIERLDDPEADPVVVKLMQRPSPAGVNWMQSLTEKNLQAVTGGSDLPEALAVRRLAV